MKHSIDITTIGNYTPVYTISQIMANPAEDEKALIPLSKAEVAVQKKRFKIPVPGFVAGAYALFIGNRRSTHTQETVQGGTPDAPTVAVTETTEDTMTGKNGGPFFGLSGLGVLFNGKAIEIHPAPGIGMTGKSNSESAFGGLFSVAPFSVFAGTVTERKSLTRDGDGKDAKVLAAKSETVTDGVAVNLAPLFGGNGEIAIGAAGFTMLKVTMGADAEVELPLPTVVRKS